MRCAILILLLLAGMQGVFWFHTRHRLPDMSIVPEVPGKNAVQALSLGESQAFFRILGLQIQNAGDTYGRFTALNKYDYNKLSHWFVLLDTLDNQSNYIPSMASYYYSQTQNTPDVQHIVDYLVQHARGREQKKWWWIVQAVYLAQHKLEDKPQALEIAKMLIGVRDIPVWAQQLPAFIYEQQGEMDAALMIIEDVMKNSKDLSPGELSFMRYFVEERLHRLEQLENNTQQQPEK